MEKLEIKETFKTPKINFDSVKGILEIEGRSIPEDPGEFYKPIFAWLDEYHPKKGVKTKVRLQFYYYNTSSAKRISSILKKLDDLYKKGNDVKIKWEYEDGDDDGMHDGEEFGNLLSLPFEIVKVEN